MLSKENNDLICQVGKGTPMGELMRRYWVPALPSCEFPEPDGLPKRMRLLGENFIMFRDSEGHMGALEESCPHRGASLYFGRTGEGGIRCAYHGWKFDRTGQCLDAPSEKVERREKFCANIRARAYPCHEVNHMVWVFMGTGAPPPFPAFEVNTLPEDQLYYPLLMMQESNYLQNLEGDLDSAHLDWCHRRVDEGAPAPDVGIRGFWNPTGEPPTLDVQPTDYGAFYSGRRPLPDGTDWHRINQFIFPFHTMITNGDGTINLRSYVPIDDEYTLQMTQPADAERALLESEKTKYSDTFEQIGGFLERTNDPRSYYLTRDNKRNDYGRNMKMYEDNMFMGIPFVHNLQDRAMTELMCNAEGKFIYDRTKEHLGSSDAMVVAVRRQLLNAATKLRDEGVVPANLENVELDRVRPATVVFDYGADWRALSTEARQVQPGQPLRADIGLIL